METTALSIISQKNELSQIVREKGKDNIQAKIITEEIEESNTNLKEFKTALEAMNYKMKSLLKKRESYPQEWRQAGIKDIGLEVLNHVMRENTILVENLEYTRKEQKTDMQMKARDIQLQKL